MNGVIFQFRLAFGLALINIFKLLRPIIRSVMGSRLGAAVLGILPTDGAGWILDAICREMGPHTPAGVRRFFGVRRIPPARTYFVTHYSLVPEIALLSPWVFGFGAVSVFYTHPKEVSTGNSMLMRFLRTADRICVMNSASKEALVAKGISQASIELVLCAASPEFFPARIKVPSMERPRIGISSAFYPRKNPDLLLELVTGMPENDFILVGRNWEQSPHYAELRSAPNFELRQLRYVEYPEFYRSLNVLLSISSLEGGPVPLIEALMSGVPVVATDTGFARDIVIKGVNGAIIPIEPTVSQVRESLHDVRDYAPSSVRRSVKHLNWERFTHAALGGMLE